MTHDETPARLAVLEHRVEQIERAISSIDTSMREMSKALTLLAAQTAALEQLDKRVRGLEAERDRAHGGLSMLKTVVGNWKLIAAIAAAAFLASGGGAGLEQLTRKSTQHVQPVATGRR